MINVKKLLLFFIFVFFLIPFNVFALSSDYEDILHTVVGENVEENKINIYFFYGSGCGYCAKEEDFLDNLEIKYAGKINVFRYETWYNSENSSMMLSSKTLFKVPSNKTVPFTVIGNRYESGYNDYIGEKIESYVINYLEEDVTPSVVDESKIEIPFLGKIDKKGASIGLIAIILGFVDGFNPCAMWVLLFLINMLIGMKDKKKMFLFGFTFLIVSGIVYFLAMLGISTFLLYVSIPVIRSIIGIVAVVIGVYNIKKYIDTRTDEFGCHVVDTKKRKKIFNKIKKFTNEKNIFLALLGIVLLAISVNTVELACSTVFPATFAEILAVNEISGISRIIYLVIYVLLYMIDDMVVFIISAATFTVFSSSSKYGKYSSLVGGIIMAIVGILLILKPEWVMFNF